MSTVKTFFSIHSIKMVYQNTDKVAGINYVRVIIARFVGLTK